MTTLAAKLRHEPGIDMKRLKLGTRLMVETESAVYEMRVLHQELCLVEVSVQRSATAAANRRAIRQQPAFFRGPGRNDACVRDSGLARQRTAHVPSLPQWLLPLVRSPGRRSEGRHLALQRVLGAGLPASARGTEFITARRVTGVGKA